jgi:hypothetical protein
MTSNSVAGTTSKPQRRRSRLATAAAAVRGPLPFLAVTTLAAIALASAIIAPAATATASAAPAQAVAGASSTPHVSNNSPDSSDCYGVTISGAWFWNDPGLHRNVRTTANTTCYTYQRVAGGHASILRINGGSDCIKVIHPDPNETEYASDQPCSTRDPLEQFIYKFQANGSNKICLYPRAHRADCLAVSANLNTEIVGGKQRGPRKWFFV